MNALPLPDPELRDSEGRFRKGVSGNPGGQPKGAINLSRKAREAVGGDGKLVVEFHMAVVFQKPAALRKFKLDPKKITLSHRQDSANWLIERGFGKPLGYQDVNAGEDPFGEAHDRLVAKLAPAVSVAERQRQS